MAGKYRPPAASKVTKEGVHAHGCVRCKVRFEDACGLPTDWPVCPNCKTGRSVLWQQLIDNRLPIACCRANARPIRKDEVSSYRTWQDCDWFICTKCARTFPFRNPKEIS
jgi:hypothetical protein